MIDYTSQKSHISWTSEIVLTKIICSVHMLITFVKGLF